MSAQPVDHIDLAIVMVTLAFMLFYLAHMVDRSHREILDTLDALCRAEYPECVVGVDR